MDEPADRPSRHDAPASGGFVPEDFPVPGGLEDGTFRLVPLGPEHNESDYEAWTTSIDHIRRTPGFEQYDWPIPMTPAENMADLVRHADDFRARTGFTYSVMDENDHVIGCVYIYPADRPGHAVVRSWVRKECADQDAVLYKTVDTWVGSTWPFADYQYAPRTTQYAHAD
jgi:hypothetical protein